MDGGSAVPTVLTRADDAAQRVRALAARARTQSDVVRAAGRRVAGVEGTPWRSLAAEAFREQVVDLAVRTATVADDVAGAADALERHAATAADRAAHLRRLLALASSDVETVASVARAALESALPGPLVLP